MIHLLLFCFSNDLILFTSYKLNAKSICLQCSMICVQEFHISMRVSPNVFTLPFSHHYCFLQASAIKSLIATFCLGAGLNSDSWICCVLPKSSKSDYLHFFKNPSFIKKRDVSVISYGSKVLTQYPLTLAISIVLVNSAWTFFKSTSFLDALFLLSTWFQWNSAKQTFTFINYSRFTIL